MDNVEAVFQLILFGGNARSSAMEAIMHAKAGDITAARKSLDEASKELSNAHQIQTNLIHQEAAGEKKEISLLMIHAQDHLMNAITIKDLASEFVDLYESIFKNRRLGI
ncbi:PTS lactose/cellobiose transporter subunit IIA [Tepidibacillus sp. LV47]|uniref:PTS lactose/cellobiose transporter subunit IIA n=1 Tax=Tepidibacillus sp. LV47 TaxID=3398228 RepID=UPI003AAC9BE4